MGLDADCYYLVISDTAVRAVLLILLAVLLCLKPIFHFLDRLDIAGTIAARGELIQVQTSANVPWQRSR